QEARTPPGAPAESDREGRDALVELLGLHEAVAERQLGLRELAVELGRLLVERQRLGAFVALAQDLALAPVREREVRIHLLGQLELVPGLVELAALEPHLAHTGTPGRVTLGRGLLERGDGVVEATGLECGL